MIVKIGTKLYETDFQFKDLQIFYSLGVGASIVDVINNGADYANKNRHTIPGNPAGSSKALVELRIEELYVDGKGLKCL